VVAGVPAQHDRGGVGDKTAELTGFDAADKPWLDLPPTL
jgi:hypothetical protein